jgi:hypothetical protein
MSEDIRYLPAMSALHEFFLERRLEPSENSDSIPRPSMP